MIDATRFRMSWRRSAIVAFATAFTVLAMATVALADNVQNDVVADGDGNLIVTITEGGSASVNFRIAANNGDGQPGCNAADGSAALVTINAPAGVTPTPSSLSFITCGTDQAVSFTSSVPGSYGITASVTDSGPGTYNTNPAKFTLKVEEAPPAGDTTPPVISITAPADGATYLLGQAVLADYSCTDAESDVTLCEGPVAHGAQIDTGSVGAKSFTVNAASAGGNSFLTHSYSVIYDWSGFFRPVDNLPTLNLAKAGSAIPVKFSLAGNQGLGVMASGFPTSKTSSCSEAGAPDTIEETITAGQSSLSYDALSDQYNYVWKTDKGWAGTCRTLTVKLADNTVHQALFKLTK